MSQKILITLRSVLILCLCGFSVFMLFAAPYELYRVAQVHGWEKVPARVLYIGSHLGSGQMNGVMYQHLMIEDLQTRKQVKIIDIRPGDLPFSTTLARNMLYDSRDADLNSFAKRRDITVYRAPGGEHYYLDAGSPGLMTGILVLSIGWLLGLFVVARYGVMRSKQSA